MKEEIEKIYEKLYEIQRPVDIYTSIKFNDYTDKKDYVRKHPSLIKEYYENSKRMTDFLKEEFEKLGFSVSVQNFTLLPKLNLECKNVVAFYGEGDSKIGIGFHRDINYLEGASDGKSQIVTSLLSARELVKKKLNNELVIVGFDAEEYNFGGSQCFSEKYGKDFKFLLNVDNVSSGKDLAVVAKTFFTWYPEKIIKFFENKGLVVESWDNGAGDSDSFLMNCIPSITLTCTHEHSIANTIEDCYFNINFNTLIKAIKKIPVLIEELDKTNKFNVNSFTANNAKDSYNLFESRIKGYWVLGSRLLNKDSFTVSKVFDRINAMDDSELTVLEDLLNDSGKENFLHVTLPYVIGEPSEKVKKVLGLYNKEVVNKVEDLLKKKSLVKVRESVIEEKRLCNKLKNFY